MKPVLVPGVCRVCRCTDLTPCKITILVAAGRSKNDGFREEDGACSWIDYAHTLCSNLKCIAVVPMDEIAEIAEDLHALAPL